MTPRIPPHAHALLRAGLSAAQLAETLSAPLEEAAAWQAAYAADLLARRRRRTLGLASAGLCVALGLGLAARTALSQSTCAQTAPFGLVTFCADAPALATDVNGNFALLANWVNEKVGARGSTTRIESSTTVVVNTTSNAGLQLGGPLTVSGSVRVGDDAAACTTATVGALRSRPTGLERCTGAGWAVLGPGGAETISCKTLLTANPALGNGHYVLKAAGYQFSADCDMAGGGWTLVQAHAASTRTVESLALTPFNGTYLPAGAVRALARAATQVRIDSSVGSVASLAGGSAILGLRGLSAMQENGNSWTLLSGAFDRNALNFSCGTTSRYPDTYHACGNTGGVHIIGDVHTLTNGANSDINLWVR